MKALAVFLFGMAVTTCLAAAPLQASSQQIKIQDQQLNLDDVVQTALGKNPGVESARRRFEALKHRIPQERSLPDPMLTIGWAGDPVPFKLQKGDPSSARTINPSQQFPYPGKLKLRADIADKEAQAVYWDYEEARRSLVVKVKTAYFEYFFATKALAIAQKNQELLQKLLKIAEARYRVGKGIQQDVLRAQVELSRLLQRITILTQQRQTAIVRLNTLMFRAPEDELDLPGDVRATGLDPSLEELYASAEKNDTGLQREQKMIERSEVAIALAKRDYLPDFNVGYLYQQRPGMPDMHGMSFGINIPIFYRTKQRERVAQVGEELVSNQRGWDDRKTTLFFEVKEQYLTAKASDELIRLYSKAIIPQSSLALESSIAAYEVGNVDFLSLIASFSTVLDYETEYYREVTNYQQALARLEPLTGLELTK